MVRRITYEILGVKGFIATFPAWFWTTFPRCDHCFCFVEFAAETIWKNLCLKPVSKKQLLDKVKHDIKNFQKRGPW